MPAQPLDGLDIGLSMKKIPKDFYDRMYKGNIYSTDKYVGNRLEWVNSLLNHLPGNSRILEIGCGRGHLQDLPGYFGLDISLEAAKFFQKPFICGSAEALPFPDGIFDAVMSFTVLEHL